MDRYWKVLVHRGKRMELEHENEPRIVKYPTKPFARQLFRMVRAGQLVDDKTVELFVNARLPTPH